MPLIWQKEFEALFEQAIEHHEQGRVAEALALYDAAIELSSRGTAAPLNGGPAARSGGEAGEPPLPGRALAHFNRAVALKELTRLEEAVASYDSAIALDPELVEAHCNRGNALRDLGRAEEALRSYDEAIRLRPGFALAHHNRASALHDLGRWDEAFASYERALALAPDFLEARDNLALAHNNKGSALRDQEHWNGALECYEQAIALKPDDARFHVNRADALRVLGRPDEALQSCDRAIAVSSEFADSADIHSEYRAFVCRGNVLKDLVRLPEALESYDRALLIQPDSADALWNKGYCALMMGDFARGWPLCEWRRKKTDAPQYLIVPQPEWTGREELAGKTLLVYAEQGLGDTIQFCRYVLLARERRANVKFMVQPPLVRLLKSLGPEVEILSPPAEPGTFDRVIPLLSMPGAFRTTPTDCPAKTPYLGAEPDKVAEWRKRLGTDGFKIGICWHGNRRNDIKMGRSVSPEHFERLAQIPGLRLISLQKEEEVAHWRANRRDTGIEFLGPCFDAGLDAFVDAAAVMENLDLIVTSDTAVAHLAGALHRPVWTLVPLSPDWRWLLGRSDSPWYPSMQLFRQTRRNDWTDVFAVVESQLRERMSATDT